MLAERQADSITVYIDISGCGSANRHASWSQYYALVLDVADTVQPDPESRLGKRTTKCEYIPLEPIQPYLCDCKVGAGRAIMLLIVMWFFMIDILDGLF